MSVLQRLLDPLHSITPQSGSADSTWKPLRYFNFYRILLSGLFLSLYWSGPSPIILGQHDDKLFELTALSYLIFSLLSAITISRRLLPFILQTNIQVVVDITAITLLMHASGGITTGLGILIVVAIAGGSIIMEGKLAILYAAIASLLILAEQVFADVFNLFETTAYTQAGVLGTTCFATALLSHIFARRVRASEALARQRGVDLANLEQVNDYIVRFLQAGIMVVDKDDRIWLINESAQSLLGVTHALEHQPVAAITRELWLHLQAWREEPYSDQRRFQSPRSNNHLMCRFARLGSSKTAATLIFIEDSTHVADQLQQMKLASLGQLTASIAHEIRNPLGAISHAAQLLQESPSLETEDFRLTEIIRNHSRRMNTIIENILQLSRRENSHPKMILLKHWLRDFVEELCLIENVAITKIRLDVQPNELSIFIDTNQLQQILWNLCKNALLHAKNHAGELVLSLRASRMPESGTPYLDIIDYGSGIPQEIIDNMFKPFFTTCKGGTGLGLYIARELCECNKARLAYLPTTHGGSCFRISFFVPK